ncbi:DUF3253 domain-containing protein [Roseomonas indoligenes]|uniref:DUF3253 domain-containing protein n=1 Tax=Roseomonas indoligenes TaxID=2820811 RepID=A0A940S7C4_9PROT|nr:DUF3253 domain-containing protein [Pararoseomonas indoligenes]MBP0492913.1 DUF3253 domain-containing protein [Pararoseomonas indoligenes]
MTPRPDRDAIKAEILRQTTACGPGRSISPSDVARALAEEGWQSLLGPIRQAAMALAQEGQLEVLRKGKPVAPEALHGVVRLRLPGTNPTAD